MTAVVRENWKYFSGALLLHGVLVALLFVSIHFTSPQTPAPQLAIKATLVDKSLLRQLERGPDREAETQKKAQEAEQQRLQQEAERRRQQEQTEREAEQQKVQREAEQQREVEKQKQVEAQQQTEAKQRQIEEQQRQQAEQKRIAEIQQKQREVEQRKRTEAEAKAQAQREAELKAQLESEEGETQAVNAGLQSQYVAMIQQKVIRNWLKPASAKPGLLCKVAVAQTTNGTVLSAQVLECNGDAAVRQSIEAAVLSSSPLPAPPDPRVFQRNLVFNFVPKE